MSFTVGIVRDGETYDTEARRQMARDAIKAHDVRQPRGIPRPDGPNGALFVMKQAIERNLAPDYFVELAQRYPQVAHWTVLGRHLYALNSAEIIEHVHREYARDLHKSRALHEAKVLLGNGLLTSEDDEHLRQRRLVQPAFHRDRIREYGARMVAATQDYEPTWEAGAEVDMAAAMSTLTLDIVGRTLFSADLRADADGVGHALMLLMEAFPRLMLPGGQLLARIPGTDLHSLPAQMDELDLVVQRIIAEHRAKGDTGDLLSMLIEAQEDGAGMDDAQIRDEVMTLVLAGHETTAMNLTWAWYLLSANPAEAAWMHEELDTLLAGRAPTFDDLTALPRTRAVVFESLRLFPPAWIFGRTAMTELRVGEWVIPEGSVLLTSQYAMHRDPRYWDSASSFRPQRWLTDDGEFSEKAPGQPRGSWFPFGYGKRRCIGDQFALTEATLVLATLAQRWRPQLVPGSPVEPFGAITLRPRDGMPMTLVPR